MKHLCVLFFTCLVMVQISVTAQDSITNRLAVQPTPARVTITLPNGRAADIPKGPYKATWESIKENYTVPEWFKDAKFGIFMHFGVYTVAAHASEWYPRHMYSNGGVQKWHEEHFGRVDTFGYKDMIPLFKTEKFNADEWAELFQKSGAKYIIPTAEHHDGFAMYDSKLTKWNAKNMGPHKDIIGELSEAVRKQGIKFGLSNHRMENWDFMYPMLKTKTDLFDPKYADFYGPPQLPPKGIAPKAGEEVIEDQNDAPQSKAFLEEWLARCQELVDKYKPDIFWFDNGVNSRKLDSIKLRFAAYYYNRASKWGKAVSISTKSDAYLYGSIRDFERQGRAPKTLTDYVWEVDDPIGEKFGYVEGMKLQNTAGIVRKLVDNVSHNGNYLLNISPKSDGTIPDEQQQILLGIGKWLQTNGDAIYGTRAWAISGEDNPNKYQPKQPGYRFTTKGNTLYAIALGWPEKQAIITSLATGLVKGKVENVTLLGYYGKLKFMQDNEGLKIDLPTEKIGDIAYAFKIEGLLLK